ncbi:MAG TPA: MFS transporter [Roseiflexaceae bacterium]|nr:MFS transporter [Roseiflexaceae bacterium]
MTPFRSPAFRRLWCSSLASTLATGIERTTTAWLALELGGGAVTIGLIFAARMLPSLLFALAAGTIADRAERPRQLLAVSGAALLLMATFGWLVATGSLRVWQVVVFAFAAGCLMVFDTPARQALVLDTVPREAAPSALALTALVGRFANALGALGAGVLIPRIGAARCYLVIAMAYAVAALLAATLRMPQAQRVLVALPPFSRAFRDAARLMIDVPAVRTLFVAGIACEIFAFSHMSALPLFAQDVLATGAEGLGTLNAALAMGGACAVALLALLPARLERQPLLGAIFLVYGLSIVALAATRELAVAAAVLVVTGCCAGAFDVLLQTLIQMAVPDEQRGRAVGVWMLGLGSAPVGHLEMGVMIAALGPPTALLINGALTVAAAAALLARAPDYRWTRWARPTPD